MDLCLNISSTPVQKTNNIQGTKSASNDSAFEFKWESSKKKVKPAFVNRKARKGSTIFSQKQTTLLNKNAKKSDVKANSVKTKSPEANNNEDVQENEEIEMPKFPFTKNEPMNQFKKKSFPLFDKFSEAAIGTAFTSVVGKSSVEEVFSSSGKTFENLGIHPHTVTNLERTGLKTLTAVQEKTIPLALEGKNVFVRSQTGSGKTLAYAIPIVEALRSIKPHISRQDGVQAIVVVPTRELALQTYELFLKLVEPFRWIVPGKLCGGENRNAEKARIRKGINILVGPPGRLLDHLLHTKNLKVDKVRCLVLDEADRLLDMGFQKDINKLVELIDASKNHNYDPIALMKSRGKPNSLEENTTEFDPPLKTIISKERQTILLSATLTSNVKDLASFAMKDYIYVDPLNPQQKLDIDSLQEDFIPEIVVPESVKQEFVVTDVKTRLVVLAAFIVSKVLEKNCKMFVFMASQQMVEFHEILFNKCLKKRPISEGQSSNAMVAFDDFDDDDDENFEENILDVEFFKLHGSMDQMERVEIFKAFRAAKTGVLLCTDVVARGVDIPHADYVVQYTGPLQDEDYIHRVGRTGRVGKKGHALLFLTEPELEYVAHLKDKKLFLKRRNQESILQNLVPFMDHMSPGSTQSAAEFLQRRFEKAIIADKTLQLAACFAYSTWSRYYSSIPTGLRKFLDIKKAHLGHYVTSFALRCSPQEVGRFVRRDVGRTEEKKLNKKLDNHQVEEADPKPKIAAPKKRPRSQELMISEFDSGLTPAKKKKRKN